MMKSQRNLLLVAMLLLMSMPLQTAATTASSTQTHSRKMYTNPTQTSPRTVIDGHVVRNRFKNMIERSENEKAAKANPPKPKAAAGNSSPDDGASTPQAHGDSFKITPRANTDLPSKYDHYRPNSPPVVHDTPEQKLAQLQAEHDPQINHSATPTTTTPTATTNDERESVPSFLSATVVIKMGPVAQIMDSARQSMLGMAVTLFLEKIFDSQTKYDIAVRSVGVVEQGLAEMEGGAVSRTGDEGDGENESEGEGDVDVDGPGSDGDDTDNSDVEEGVKVHVEIEDGNDRLRNLSVDNNGQARTVARPFIRRALSRTSSPMVVEVESVITAQYTRNDSADPVITSEEYAKMLEHVFDKFEDSLVDIIKEQETGEGGWGRKAPYFDSIEFVSVEIRTGGSTKGTIPGSDLIGVNDTDDSSEGSNAFGIAALVLSIHAFVVIAVVVYRRRRPKLPILKLSSKDPACEDEIDFQNIAPGQEDDFSFSSQQGKNRSHLRVPSVKSFTNKHIRKEGKKNRGRQGVQTLTLEDKIARYDLSERLGKERSRRSMASDNTSVCSTSTTRSGRSKKCYMKVPSDTVTAEFGELEEEEKGETLATMRNECYAPPGKLGVALDTIAGQPVIHRLKAGSPLQGILQPRDRIVAIDGVDTRNMSAADATHLMVKGLKRVRKISYVRTQRKN